MLFVPLIGKPWYQTEAGPPGPLGSGKRGDRERSQHRSLSRSGPQVPVPLSIWVSRCLAKKLIITASYVNPGILAARRGMDAEVRQITR